MTDALSPQCRACKLYEKAAANDGKCFAMSYGQQTDIDKPVDLYIVTGKIYDHERKFLGDEAGQWIMRQVIKSGLTYIVDGVTRCSSNRPTAAQKKLCTEQYLQPNIKTSRPRIIWCLGLDAAQAVLGSTLGLNQLQKAGIIEGPYHTPVIVTDHPSNHSSFKEDQFRGQDLRPAISQAWYHIAYILKHGYQPAKLEHYKCTADINEALEWAAQIALETPVFAFDTEFGVQANVNISHPTTKLLCWGIGYYFEGKYKTFVFDCRDWTGSQRYKALAACLNQATLVTTFGKIDIMVLWFTSQYHAYHRGVPGIHELHDTGQIRWCLDQEQFNNGLEDQCVEAYGAERWKYKTDDALKLIQKEGLIPLENGLEGYDYRHLDRDFCNEYQAWDVYHQARLWWEKYADPENAAHLNQEYFTWTYRRSQAMTPVICWIERVGMIVDQYYLNLYKEALEKKVDIMYKWIQAHPFVQEMRITPDPDRPERPDLDKDGNQKLDRYKQPKVKPAEMMIPECEFNPASPIQMQNLFKFLGLTAVRTSKKTKAPKLDKLELMRQAGGSMLMNFARTGQQKFFAAIMIWRGVKKQLASFVLPFQQYAITHKVITEDEDYEESRVHTNFKMVKVLEEQGTDAMVEGGTDSSRFSTADPCISNIIKNKVFREAFLAPPGKLFWEADQASVEPRVLGYNANCQALIEIFELKESDPDNPDADLYKIGWRNFQRAQGKTWFQAGDVTEEERTMAKPLILGSFYESSALGIHQRENIPLSITSAFLTSFWAGFPELLAYNAEIRRKVFEGEPVVSCAGQTAVFRLYGNYAYDHDKHKHLTLPKLCALLDIQDGPGSDAELIRKAENHMTQSAAKAVTDVLLIELNEWLWAHGEKQGWLPDLDLNNTVHDSGWGYVREGREQELFVILRNIVRNPKFLAKWGIVFTTTAKRVLFDLEMKAGPTLARMEKVHLPKANSPLMIPGLLG